MKFDNFVSGEWVNSDKYFENINPSDISDTVGEYALGEKIHMDQAINAAQNAFSKWSQSGVQERFQVLDKVGTELLTRVDELGKLLAREEGKTLVEAKGEVSRAGQIFKYYAAEAIRQHGEIHPSVRPGIIVEVTREPIGVIGVITPWNFPIAIPAWKVAPALAFGNTVVLKPSSLAPGSAWALAEILSRSGLPPGAFNLVMGSGGTLGQQLLDQVDAVTFTGSVETGAQVLKTTAARKIKCQTEMGGKNPLVVLDDGDLDLAVSSALNGAFFSTGQRCTASSRLIVTKGIHGKFVEALTLKLKTLRVGNALDPETQMGPVINQSQLEQNLKYIEIGKAEGAQLVWGGEILEKSTKGFYMSPALFTKTKNSMRINREEVFGPVATVIEAADYETALNISNDTQFGLSSGLITTSLKHAQDFKRRSKSGMVMINCPTAGVDYHVPFGGTKGSSYGPREQGSYASEFFTTVKTSYVMS